MGRRGGRWGEWVAVVLLLCKGYRIRARTFAAAGGEVDVVAERRRVIAFVEVKARSSGAFGGAAAAVTAGKQVRIARAAAVWLSQNERWGTPCRFDVITIERRSRFPFLVLGHIEHAFTVELDPPL